MAEFGTRFGIGKPLNPSLAERMDRIDELVADGREEEPVTRDMIRAYFAVASAAIEDDLTQLVFFRLIQDGYRNKDVEEYIAKWVNEIKLLKLMDDVDDDLGAIDDHLESNIQDVREVRNKCVHGQTPPTPWDEELRPTAMLAIDVVDELYELVQASVERDG